jgi:hypothetical protein
MSRMFCNSPRVSKRVIRKLHLDPGDAIIARDMADVEALKGLRGVIKFNVPIIVAPHGIKRLSLEYLQKLITEMEYAHAQGSK